jgi:hypothetical protein
MWAEPPFPQALRFGRTFEARVSTRSWKPTDPPVLLSAVRRALRSGDANPAAESQWGRAAPADAAQRKLAVPGATGHRARPLRASRLAPRLCSRRHQLVFHLSQGLFPADVRFQVSMPMVNSVIRPLYFPEGGDIDKLRPGFEEALAAEIALIVRRIPAKDLAIQWDLAGELIAVYGQKDQPPSEASIETHVAPVRRLSTLLPADVALGFHFCFGTFGGRPAFAPPDLGRAVELINACVAAAGRRTDWIHIPTLPRTDEAFYAPLSRLEARGARIYLGAIHSMATLGERLAAARQFVPRFGLAAYCGFGRTPPEQLPQLLDDHIAALALLKGL